MKLFIARTKAFGVHVATKLRIDRNEWFIVGLGDSLVGRKFTDYVDITDGPLSVKEAEWLRHTLMKCDTYRNGV